MWWPWDELSLSKVAGERDAAKTIETDAIPTFQKLQKKKGRELKKKRRQARQQNLLTNFYGAGITRSCHNHRRVNYLFVRGKPLKRVQERRVSETSEHENLSLDTDPEKVSILNPI